MNHVPEAQNPLHPLEFKGDHLVVCEGFSDAKTICALLDRHKRTNSTLDGFGFYIGRSKTEGVEAAGKTAIPKLLKVASTRKPEWDAFRSVTVVVDCDELDRNQLFNEAADWLVSVGLERPSQPNAVHSGQSKKTGVLMIPEDGQGTLEHVLLGALSDVHPNVRSCLDTFVSCAIGQSWAVWGSNYQAKMQVQSFLAALYHTDPCLSLAWMCGKPDTPIPLDSQRFAFILDFFASVAS